MGLENEISIVIAGDLCPTKDTEKYFASQDSHALFNDVLPILQEADFTVGNLEFVLTDFAKPIKKAGPILHGRKEYVKVLKDAGFDAVSLANNHIKDCGEDGVRSTIESCLHNDIAVFGAGKNMNEAKKPLIVNIKGRTIGFLSFAEQEYNTASNTEYGASYFDPLEDLDLIAEIRKEVDYLVVLYHGGIEYYRYPSPLLKKKCRKFIDKGADLVTCQHSHCIGTIDTYQDKNIIYGQGNTLFGFRKNDLFWNQGLLIKLDFISHKKEPTLHLIPVTATEQGLEKLERTAAELLLADFYSTSKKVAHDDFLATQWKEFCIKKENLYLPFLLGYNRAFIHLNRLFKNRLVTFLHSGSKLSTSHNIIRCEAHNEVIQTILKHQTKE